MASYSLNGGDIGLWEKPLAANVVDTVTITRGRKVLGERVRVTNDSGGSPIYFTVDGSQPAVGGAKCHRVPALRGGSVEADVLTSETTTTVRIVSAGSPAYSVEGCR